MRPELLRSEPRRLSLSVNGIALSAIEWPAEAVAAPNAPTILLLHATGFHARVWDAVVRALPRHLRVIAVDQRGHGHSGGKVPIEAWSQFADDAAELIDRLELRDVVGVGHSMGGQCIAATALRRPHAFRSLVLVDPVMPSPEVYGINRFAGLVGPHEHPLAQRRNRWSSWQEMRDAFATRSPYSLWRPEVLEAYCRYGLLPAADGDGFVLACPPVVEASVYMQARNSRILDRLGGIGVPVTILRAKYTPQDPGLRVDFTRSATWEGLASHFLDARDVYLPELTHFIVMQAPELVADHVVAAMRATTAGGGGTAA